jgi:hypothetical protein
MAAAVAAGDGGGYGSSVKAAYDAEVSMQRAFEALRPLGYEVR